MSPADLPHGVELRELTPHPDERGVFTELYREEWGSSTDPIQWNAVRSNAGVLRGVHVHLIHADYLTVVSGGMTLGLCDLRPHSPTFRQATALTIDADTAARAVAIPPGVAHGFYFERPSIHVYAVSHYWDVEDELGCRWDDPALGIPWGHDRAQISQRDADLPALEILLERVSAHYDSESSVST